MVGIPPALDTDAEDVAWALQTAEALWKRNERVDAIVWLRRAAQAAGEAQDDDRALALARDAAELAEWMARNPPPAAVSHRSSRPPPNAPTAGEAVDELLRTTGEPLGEVEIEPVSEAASGDRPSQVPTAAEKHAGLLDPWADGEAPTRRRDAEADAPPAPRSPPPHAPPAPSPARPHTHEPLAPPPRPPMPPAASAFDEEEIVTSAPPLLTKSGSVRAAPAAAFAPARAPASAPAPASAAESAPAATLDLSSVEALADLPDGARDAFARAAAVQPLTRDEEVSAFALALVLDGEVDLAATIVDAPARRLGPGSILRARGTIDHVAPIRLIAASDQARVATWDERAVEQALRTCPWVEHELRAAADRLQAEVGVTMGPLGERLDASLRADVVRRFTLRALIEHEACATAGRPIPGLLVVGAGEVTLVDSAGAPVGQVLRAGDFLFPREAMQAAPAPLTARAAKGGALVLFAEFGVAQELLVTCPPLLEILAGA
jgi:hypothetical protein